MKERSQERIGIYYVNTANRDLSEICSLCSRFISRGQWYVRAKVSKIAHYRCAKRVGWKKDKAKSSGIVEKPKQISPKRAEWFNDPKLKRQRLG